MKQVGIYMRVMTQGDGVSESLNRKLIAQLPVSYYVSVDVSDTSALIFYN